jgi:transglutaminase-like putative cysteine protease
MAKINVGCSLSYEVRKASLLQLQISVAQNSFQQITNESLFINGNTNFTTALVGPENVKLNQVSLQPGTYDIEYRASVELTPDVDKPTELQEVPIAQLPPATLTYLNPSRYCETDMLSRFAFEEFGEWQSGFAKVQGISDWVNDHLDYEPGSTNGTTTATQVLLQRNGVCRDYAHLMITLCRCSGIPARYVSGYAVNLQPPDFHGFVEAYLDGQWYLFDPTKLAPVDGLVRIGCGRDAADVAFATIYGDIRLARKEVWANPIDPTNGFGNDGTNAVSTA